MTKSPYPLLDSTMLGPLLVCANIFLGCPVPEVYLLSAVLVRGHTHAHTHTHTL